MTPCPVCGYSGDKLSPADAAAALRSFPRRFREWIEYRPDDPQFAAARANAAAEADAAAAEITVRGEELRQILVGGNPTLHDPDVVASALENVTAYVARLIDSTAAPEWTRKGQRGPAEVTAMDVLTEAVHAGVHHLRLAEEAFPRRD